MQHANTAFVAKVLAVTILALSVMASTGCPYVDIQKMDALRSGDLQRVQRFYKSPADLHNHVKAGTGPGHFVPPLHFAVKYGNVETVNYLLGLGASPNERDTKGRSAFFYLPYSEGEAECMELVALLISAGGDIEQTEPKMGLTPFLYAVLLARLEVANALAESGANIHARDPRGRSAKDLLHEPSDAIKFQELLGRIDES